MDDGVHRPHKDLYSIEWKSLVGPVQHAAETWGRQRRGLAEVTERGHTLDTGALGGSTRLIVGRGLAEVTEPPPPRTGHRGAGGSTRLIVGRGLADVTERPPPRTGTRGAGALGGSTRLVVGGGARGTRGMVGRVSRALRRRPEGVASCCFAGRSGRTRLRSEGVGMSRRPPAQEALGASELREQPFRCAGHGAAEPSPLPPGLMPEPIGEQTASAMLQRTLSPAEQRRQSRPVTSKRCGATLQCRQPLGSSNVRFIFRVDPMDQQDFRFKPGQAADVFVPLGGGGGPPGHFETKPGSYSIASTPKRFAETGEVELIIKTGGRGVPTRWLHDTAAVGDAIELCAVGSFHYSSIAEDGPGPLLLVAGGLGINPLFSILAHTHELAAAAELGPAITLLYSASDVAELTHKKQIEAIAASSLSNVNVVFTLTDGSSQSTATKPDTCDDDCMEGSSDADSSTEGSEGDGGAAETVEVQHGRIDQTLISNAVTGLTRRHIAATLATSETTNSVTTPDSVTGDRNGAAIVAEMRCYICGPPGMIEDVASLVADRGVQDTNIHFEKWW